MKEGKRSASDTDRSGLSSSSSSSSSSLPPTPPDCYCLVPHPRPHPFKFLAYHSEERPETTLVSWYPTLVPNVIAWPSLAEAKPEGLALGMALGVEPGHPPNTQVPSHSAVLTLRLHSHFWPSVQLVVTVVTVLSLASSWNLSPCQFKCDNHWHNTSPAGLVLAYACLQGCRLGAYRIACPWPRHHRLVPHHDARRDSDQPNLA